MGVSATGENGENFPTKILRLKICWGNSPVEKKVRKHEAHPNGESGDTFTAKCTFWQASSAYALKTSAALAFFQVPVAQIYLFHFCFIFGT